MESNIFNVGLEFVSFSFLLLINAAYPSHLIIDKMDYFPFIYPNLLQVLFFIQIFKQGFSTRFCLLTTLQVSCSILPPWSDHPRAICWGKVSWSSSLWNLLQSPDFSCILQIYSSASLSITHSTYTLPLISCSK